MTHAFMHNPAYISGKKCRKTRTICQNLSNKNVIYVQVKCMLFVRIASCVFRLIGTQLYALEALKETLLQLISIMEYEERLPSLPQYR